MSRLSALLLGTAMLAGAATPALAQPAPPPAPGAGAAPPSVSPAAPTGRPMAGPRGPGMMFARIDANNDGRVTFEEVWTFAQARYAEADRNRDGALVLEEALSYQPMPAPEGATRPEPNPMRARMTAAIFRAVDVNSDGRVTLDEIRPALEAQFRAMDANGDRGVTLDELPMPRHGMHPGPHPHGGPGAPPPR